MISGRKFGSSLLRRWEEKRWGGKKKTQIATCAQTEYLYMITQFGIRKGHYCGSKKHGLIVRVGNKKTYAFVTKLGEVAVGDMGRVEPRCCKKERDYGGDEVMRHVVGTKDEEPQQITRSGTKAFAGHIEHSYLPSMTPDKKATCPRL